jgi:hypothetical protein
MSMVFMKRTTTRPIPVRTGTGMACPEEPDVRLHILFFSAILFHHHHSITPSPTHSLTRSLTHSLYLPFIILLHDDPYTPLLLTHSHCWCCLPSEKPRVSCQCSALTHTLPPSLPYSHTHSHQTLFTCRKKKATHSYSLTHSLTHSFTLHCTRPMRSYRCTPNQSNYLRM